MNNRIVDFGFDIHVYYNQNQKKGKLKPCRFLHERGRVKSGKSDIR